MAGTTGQECGIVTQAKSLKELPQPILLQDCFHIPSAAGVRTATSLWQYTYEMKAFMEPFSYFEDARLT